ncbi:hypothetical protein BV898_15463 [Hypsibius exemplaris]|uniref:G-protein coupled receptors family 1 profile domain-containing protein n=1 Tax=Hypsibius exemplaris TaxID=2072580 RepID=A0A9X6RKI2_HYPEX|nr:hypothetical protein BV898_15463 [Hypsibius exemplaris]
MASLHNNWTASHVNFTSMEVVKDVGCRWPPEAMPTGGGFTINNTKTLYVEFVSYPVLLLICVMGNLLTLTILTKESKKTTTHVYLTCLAVSDMVVLFLGLPPYIMSVRPTLLMTDATFKTSTYNFRGLNFWWRETSVQFSDWSLIVFSFERLLAITCPIWFRGKATIRRAVLIECSILLLCAVCHVENAVVHYYFMGHDDGKSRQSDVLPQSLLKWRQIQTTADSHGRMDGVMCRTTRKAHWTTLPNPLMRGRTHIEEDRVVLFPGLHPFLNISHIRLADRDLPMPRSIAQVSWPGVKSFVNASCPDRLQYSIIRDVRMTMSVTRCAGLTDSPSGCLANETATTTPQNGHSCCSQTFDLGEPEYHAFLRDRGCMNRHPQSRSVLHDPKLWDRRELDILEAAEEIRQCPGMRDVQFQLNATIFLGCFDRLELRSYMMYDDYPAYSVELPDDSIVCLRCLDPTDTVIIWSAVYKEVRKPDDLSPACDSLDLTWRFGEYCATNSLIYDSQNPVSGCPGPDGIRGHGIRGRRKERSNACLISTFADDIGHPCPGRKMILVLQYQCNLSSRGGMTNDAFCQSNPESRYCD